TPWLAGLREGLHYAGQHKPIRTILQLVAAVGFLGMPYTVLVTLFAKDVLNGGPQAYGFLVTASGLGALIGAVYLATRSTVRGSPRRIVFTCLVAAASLALFAYSHSFVLSLALMLLVGMNVMLTVVSCNTIVQTLVPDDKRGRIMSLYSLAFLGLTPFGNLIVGGVTKTWGPTAGMLCCALGCLAGAIAFATGLRA